MKHIPAQQVGRLPELQMIPGPADSPSRVAARPPLCALLWKAVKVLLQKPLAFISVSSWSRHFPQAAGVQFLCPGLVLWNNRLCFLLTRVMVKNGQMVLNHISLAMFRIAQYVNSALEKKHVFKMSKSPNFPFTAHSWSWFWEARCFPLKATKKNLSLKCSLERKGQC